MMHHRGSLGMALAVLSSAASIAPAPAAFTPRSEANAQRSLLDGVGALSLPVLSRRADRAPEATLSLLLTAISHSSGAELSLEKQQDRLRVTGDGWRLDVFGDGSAAEYVNQAAANRAHSGGVEPTRAMSLEQLESAGRHFIARTLANVVTPDEGETLVPEAHSSRIEGGVAPDGTSPYAAVVANRIVFTREINGVPVVGAGSKLTLTFLNDGSVESFRYDWPRYQRMNQVQPLVGAAEILRRVQRVALGRTGGYPGRVIELPAPIPSAIAPVDLGGNVRLERLACGYYDPGLTVRDANAPVQAGCYYHAIATVGEGDLVTRAGYSGAVPAGRRVEPDRRWPEAALLSGSEVPALPPDSAAPGTSVKPVPSR